MFTVLSKLSAVIRILVLAAPTVRNTVAHSSSRDALSNVAPKTVASRLHRVSRAILQFHNNLHGIIFAKRIRTLRRTGKPYRLLPSDMGSRARCSSCFAHFRNYKLLCYLGRQRRDTIPFCYGRISCRSNLTFRFPAKLITKLTYSPVINSSW